MDSNIIQKIRDSLRRAPNSNVVLTKSEAEALVNQHDLFVRFNADFEDAFSLSGIPTRGDLEG